MIIGNGEFLCGDCLKLMETIPDKSIDMILCDLPYGTTSCAWDTIIPFDILWEQYCRIIKSNGAIVLFGTEPFSSFLRLSNLKWFKYDWIWYKSKSGSAFTAKYRPINKHENISVFAKGKTTYNPQMTEGLPYTRVHKTRAHKTNNHKIGFKSQDVISINKGERYPITVQFFTQKWRRQDQLHPTQKPVELFEYLIKTYTNPGEIVLDNCAGSGTTAIAAENTDRKWICIEKDDKYYQIASQRVKDHITHNKFNIEDLL